MSIYCIGHHAKNSNASLNHTLALLPVIISTIFKMMKLRFPEFKWSDRHHIVNRCSNLDRLTLQAIIFNSCALLNQLRYEKRCEKKVEDFLAHHTVTWEKTYSFNICRRNEYNCNQIFSDGKKKSLFDLQIWESMLLDLPKK